MPLVIGDGGGLTRLFPPAETSNRNLLATAAELRHVAAVRGFPLLRSILVLLGLAVSGLGLTRITHRATPASPEKKVAFSPTDPSSAAIPYRLSLSAQPEEIVINSSKYPAQSVSDGVIHLPPQSAVVSIAIRWKTPPAAGETRFAKLILDPPGKATITHVFDSPGDIDDLLELP